MRLPFDREATEALPKTCGVYLFLDEQGQPVYVGKATDLRSRVRSYFGKSDARIVTALIHDKARSIDFIVTSSTKEALILENSLIKQHSPRLNIRLKDDSTYFSLKLDLSEEWPRLRIVRKRPREEDALYFGPYPSAQACRKTIQHVNALFPMRTCPDAVLANRTRPCIMHEIKRCKAPCVGMIQRPDYMEGIRELIDFLRGKKDEVVRGVEAEMHAAAEALDFERAAELRDRLKHMRRTLEQPQVTRGGGADKDVIGLYETDGELSLAILAVRDGSLAASSAYAFKTLGRTADEILGAFIGQYYGPARTPPTEILLPVECADPELHREVLEEILGAAVALRVPERGEGLRLRRLAERNAELNHRRRSTAEERTALALQAMVDRFALEHLPETMECFDVSHLGGEQVVAACVRFVDGRPDKEGYRHYRLKEVQRNDDFAAMEEVLRRRLKRGLSEGDLPDLIVIDGGRAQLARVAAVFEELQIQGIGLIGLAKARGENARTMAARFERVYLVLAEVPILLDPDAPETRLLANLRDEAHRFAISYQRRLRNREKIGSVLELVPGIGRRKSQALLQHFGSVRALRAAPAESLSEVPGIPLALAHRIVAWFAENGRDEALDENLPEESE